MEQTPQNEITLNEALEKVRTGDLFLSRSDTTFSKAIRAAEPTDWTHVGIIVKVKRNDPLVRTQNTKKRQSPSSSSSSPSFKKGYRILLWESVRSCDSNAFDFITKQRGKTGPRLVDLTKLARHDFNHYKGMRMAIRFIETPAKTRLRDGRFNPSLQKRLKMVMQKTADAQYDNNVVRLFNSYLRLTCAMWICQARESPSSDEDELEEEVPWHGYEPPLTAYFCSQLAAVTFFQLGIFKAEPNRPSSSYTPLDFTVKCKTPLALANGFKIGPEHEIINDE